jgi:hypothetical protein
MSMPRKSRAVNLDSPQTRAKLNDIVRWAEEISGASAPPDVQVCPDCKRFADKIAEVYQQETDGGHREAGLINARKVGVFLDALKGGNYLEIASEYAGLGRRTVSRWTERGKAILEQWEAEGRDDNTVAGVEAAFGLFACAVAWARSAAEVKLVRKVHDAADSPQFWAAAMTALERMAPDRWGRRQEDTGVPKVVVQIGVKDSDVQITTLPAPKAASSLLTESARTH